MLFSQKQFCDESLLSVIEMLQFKTRILTELGPEERESIDQSARDEFTAHFLDLQNDCPRSSIVFNDPNPNFKYVALMIYSKYVQKGTINEINIQWSTRMELEQLMQNNQWRWNEEYEDPRKL